MIGERERDTPRAGQSWIWPVAVLLGLIALELAALLVLNGGRLAYTLDDPYIHLALAENLLGGHFGLNPGEVSAPSSSILWPFLLAPFTTLAVVEWVPLLLNTFLAVASLIGVRAVLRLAIEPAGDRRLEAATTLLTLLAIPALNLVGLVFTGMEHSLQVWMAILVVHGTLLALRDDRTRVWLLIAIVVGPLVRYENASLSAATLLCLWWRGERRAAFTCATLIAIGIGGYSFFLHRIGLSPLPTSVLAKSAVVAPDGGLKRTLYGLYYNLSSTPGLLLSLMAIALGALTWSSARPVQERRLALAFAGGIGLHLLVGRFGWYNRYEIYAWSAALLIVAYLWRAPLRATLAAHSLWKVTILATLITGVACREYVIGLANNAFASHDIFLQHYSMHRFATEFLDEPVAVNDIGWVAFQNDNYVLDLWGLASLEALHARGENEDSRWIAPLAERQGVRLAMIYEEWFPGLPEDWLRLGVLRMNTIRVTPAHDHVAFYALNEIHAPELRARLREFEAALPERASFDFDE